MANNARRNGLNGNNGKFFADFGWQLHDVEAKIPAWRTSAKMCDMCKASVRLKYEYISLCSSPVLRKAMFHGVKSLLEDLSVLNSFTKVRGFFPSTEIFAYSISAQFLR